MKSRYLILAALLVGLAALALSPRGPASAGQAQGGEVWQLVDESSIRSVGRRLIVPEVYRTARLNQAALAELLAQAPLEFTAAARDTHVVLSVPMPDGSLARFRVEESPVMEPGLAAKVPHIKTYKGQGLDDPTATARFDRTPAGFHAIILSATGTVYIDPYAQGDTTNYISYFKKDLPKDDRAFTCHLDDFEAGQSPLARVSTSDAAQAPAQEGAQLSAAATDGLKLRTYRLAVATTGEYTNFFRQPGDTDQQAKERALAAVVTSVNRVVGIYERDVQVRLVLVANQLNIIYTDPLTDPYTNASGANMLVENQSNLDNPATIGGPSAYDIGHAFSTGAGGVATLRVPCRNGSKARGVTGTSTPRGDAYDVDYVAHEMGHQFGGQHTFNGASQTCSQQRSASAAMEPGSGSTIQAYAGICDPQDLQRNSDDYFHVISIEEIRNYVTGVTQSGAGDTCDVETFTGNDPPAVDAGADYTVPKDTPFALTATGTDPDGDPLTYTWEEYDLGAQSVLDDDDDGQARPIFRSYKPTTSPTRLFPSLKYILHNDNRPPLQYACGQTLQCITGEAMPSINRTMRFKVTARDHRAGAGGVATDLAQVTVVANTVSTTGGVTLFGPFRVTQPNSSASWPGRSTQTVTWDVANTNLAPINAQNVRISLSVDGGQTFPLVLKESTPNDGSEAITVPNVDTTQARLKVEAVGNIFFDLSNADLQITADPCMQNHALASAGAVATASSVYPNNNFAPAGAIDGDRTGALWSNGGGWNDSTRDLYPDWLQVDFAGPRAINQIRVYTLQNDYQGGQEPTAATAATTYGLLDYDVQYWDGAQWITVPGGSVTNNALAVRAFAFPEVTTRSIRVLVGNSRAHYSRVIEVEALGCAAQ